MTVVSTGICVGRRGLLVGLTALLLSACTNNQPGMPGGNIPPPNMTISSQQQPPPPQSENVPAPPAGPANYFAWEPGHWHWNGQTYIWISGHYIESPYQSSVWVPGGWHYDGNLYWVWTPGHWS